MVHPVIKPAAVCFDQITAGFKPATLQSTVIAQDEGTMFQGRNWKESDRERGGGGRTHNTGAENIKQQTAGACGFSSQSRKQILPIQKLSLLPASTGASKHWLKERRKERGKERERREKREGKEEGGRDGLTDRQTDRPRHRERVRQIFRKGFVISLCAAYLLQK